MIPYRIRRAKLADIPALNQIIAEAAQQLNAADYTQAQIDSVLKYGYGVDAQLIEDGTYFVAEMNGRILGSGGWSRHRALHNGELTPESETPLSPLFDAAKIRAMFVHPQFSRQGIGRALLTVSETAARQADFKRLELMATLTGEPLYAAFGFVVQERYEEILPDGTPFAVALMVKQLEPQAYGSDLIASTSAASFAPPSGAVMRTQR